MTFKNMLLLSASLTLPLAHDNTNGWKKDADGKLISDDNGNPIYVDTAGSEMTVGGDTIAKLNNEAKTNRERAETAETSLKLFEGIDPDAARTAIETVANLDGNERVTAEDIKKMKADAAKTARAEIETEYQGQITERDNRISEQSTRIDTMIVDNAFNGSEFIRDNIAVPADMVRSTFGSNFKVEDGELVPYDSSGNKIFSKKNMGKNASFDEALGLIVESHPNRDQILRDTSDGNGSGSQGRGGNRGGTGRRISRADFDNMSPADKAKTAGEARKGEVTIAN